MMRYWGIPLLCLLFLSCSEKKANKPRGKILAKVGDEVLTERDLELLFPSGGPWGEKGKEAFIREWVKNTLLYLAAKEDGYLHDSSILKRLEWVQKVTVAQEYWSDKLKEAKIPEDVVDSLLREGSKYFGREVKLLLVFFEDPLRGEPIRKGLASRRRYRRTLISLKRDPTVNIEETGWVNLGLLPYEYPMLPEKVCSILLEMKRGDVSKVILTDGAYLIIKLLGTREEKMDSTEIREILRETLLDKERRELEDSLVSKLKRRFSVWIGGFNR